MRLFFSVLDCRGEDYFFQTMFFRRITKDQKQIWQGLLNDFQKMNDDLSNVEYNWVFDCMIELLPNIFIRIAVASAYSFSLLT